MTGRIFLFTAALTMLGAAHANAQARSNTVVPIQRGRSASTPVVHDFQPRTGAVGTLVTIHGAGFTPATRLFMGGRSVPALEIQPHEITFRVPQRCGNGFIELRHPGMGGSFSVGSFSVMELLQVSHLSPRSGAPGARVDIHGRGFRPGDRVYLNGDALTIHALTPTRIRVTIPDHATTGHLVVRRADGVAERSRQAFRVQAYPEVVNLSTRQGYAGMRITLRGRYLDRVDEVLLGQQPLALVSRQHAEIIAEIPAGARSGRISLQSGNRRILTDFRFQVLSGPRVSSMAPLAGVPGTEVTLRGSGFGPATRVFFGNYEAPVLRWSEHALVVQVPAGMRPGRRMVRVHDGPREARAGNRFHIQRSLRLTRVSPGRIDSGRVVMLHGSGFTASVQVFWGGHELPVRRVSRRGHRIAVTVPAHLSGTHYLVVDDGIRRVQSSRALEVMPVFHHYEHRDRVEIRDHRHERRGDIRVRHHYR